MSDFENDDFDRRPIAHIVLLKFSSEKEFLSERTQGRPQKFAPEGGWGANFFYNHTQAEMLFIFHGCP